MDLLTREILGNTLAAWSVAAAITGVAFLVLVAVRGIAVRRVRTLAERSATRLDDLAVDLLDAIKGILLAVIALYLGILALSLPPVAAAAARRFVIIAVLLQGMIWGNRVIAFWVREQERTRREQDAASLTTANLLGFILRIALYSLGVLLVLDNLGVDVTALVASLGIGGVAVALAVQNVLGDLFACLAISLDKPFVIGDFIVVGDLLGVVEHVGLKTTRVRSLSGEQLVFGNNDLLSSRIRNFKRMQERRVVFGFGVVYQTPADQLETIPQIVRDIIDAQEGARFDRAHFKAYGESSLDFEVVYYVNTPDYNTYMDIQQAINLSLFRRFEDVGIDFAYPTRTLYLDRGAAAP